MQRCKTNPKAKKRSAELFHRGLNFGGVKHAEEPLFFGYINNVTISQDGDAFSASFSICVQDDSINTVTAPENIAVGIYFCPDAE